MFLCFGSKGSRLILAGYQTPFQASLSLPSAAGQGSENTAKGARVEIKTERDLSSNTVTGKTQIKDIN